MKRIYLDGLKKVLTPRELKNVLGGSGGGPNNWPECCYCTARYYADLEHKLSGDPPIALTGWACGNEGDSDCYNGEVAVYEQLHSMGYFWHEIVCS